MKNYLQREVSNI